MYLLILIFALYVLYKLSTNIFNKFKIDPRFTIYSMLSDHEILQIIQIFDEMTDTELYHEFNISYKVLLEYLEQGLDPGRQIRNEVYKTIMLKQNPYDRTYRSSFIKTK